MAYKQLQNLGQGNNNSLSIYTITSDMFPPNKNTSDTLDVNSYLSLIKKFGFDWCPYFDSSGVGEGGSIRFYTFKNGNYINGYFTTVRKNYTSSSAQFTGNLYAFTLRFYNSAGALLFESNTINTWTNVTTTSGSVLSSHLYFTASVNEETSELYINVNYWQGQRGYFTVTRMPVSLSNKPYSEKSQYTFVSGNFEEYDTDPWANAGYSGIGGGDGIFDFNSDIIGLPTIPTVDATSSGFLQLFSGTLSKVRELSNYMWTDNFLENLVKITDNPLDIIMGLYMYPFTVPTSASKQIRAGNVVTPITMGVPSSQIFEFDCGNFPVPNFYGAYLDYEPFTKCEVFLPYCGTFPLSMDDIAGKTVNIKYRIDLLTGVCCAYIIVDGTVKYNFTGACAINIPISSRSFENLYNSIMGVVGNAFKSGSFGLPSVGSVAGAVTSGKNQIQHGGNVSGNSGYLGVQNPYLIFSVPNVAIPKGLNKYTGYPIFSTYALEDLEGYTEIEKIHLENMGNATQEEINTIIGLLDKGVIF